jgi:hypothetical protein
VNYAGGPGGDEDGQESLKWLDEVLAKYPTVPRHRAVDAGAGVGRVTRSVLLKCATNHPRTYPGLAWRDSSVMQAVYRGEAHRGG